MFYFTYIQLLLLFMYVSKVLSFFKNVNFILLSNIQKILSNFKMQIKIILLLCYILTKQKSRSSFFVYRLFKNVFKKASYFYMLA